MNTHTTTPPAAKWLGYAGALPFIAGAIGSMPFAEALRPFAFMALLGYGAIILSFMGGVHWGVAMIRGDHEWAALGRSIVPALLALLAVMLGGAIGLGVLAAGFAGLLAYDEQETRAGRVPEWYPSLRRPLTAIVVTCLVIGALARLV